jgi:hypothetical protein
MISSYMNVIRMWSRHTLRLARYCEEKKGRRWINTLQVVPIRNLLLFEPE